MPHVARNYNSHDAKSSAETQQRARPSNFSVGGIYANSQVRNKLVSPADMDFARDTRDSYRPDVIRRAKTHICFCMIKIRSRRFP